MFNINVSDVAQKDSPLCSAVAMGVKYRHRNQNRFLNHAANAFNSDWQFERGGQLRSDLLWSQHLVVSQGTAEKRISSLAPIPEVGWLLFGFYMNNNR